MAQVSTRIFTIPNLLSLFRLLLIPVFLVLLVNGQYVWALVVLVACFRLTAPFASMVVSPLLLSCVPSSVVLPPDLSVRLPPVLMLPVTALSELALFWL